MYQVMIVDDEPNALKMLADYVQKVNLGFHIVARAQGAEDALFYFKMSIPDLIITDIRMPAMDGLELLHQMRQAGWNGYAAIITGHDDFTYAQQAIRLNVFEYILKPFFPEDIAALLTRTLELLNRETVKRDCVLHNEIDASPIRAEWLENDRDGCLPEFIVHAVAHIRNHYADSLTLSQVAKTVSVNPAYLSACFTKYCGENFLEYITRYRISKSKELLAQTSLQIQEVANRVGYPDVAYFSRVFRRVTGRPPSAFRMESRQ